MIEKYLRITNNVLHQGHKGDIKILKGRGKCLTILLDNLQVIHMLITFFIVWNLKMIFLLVSEMRFIVRMSQTKRH